MTFSTNSAKRLSLAAACLLTATLGYAVRFHAPAPEWLRDASGGAAYVVFWILAAAIVFTEAAPFRLALFALMATCAVEFLQLWRPPWLEALRATLPGRLVLGTTFAWQDFPPYIAGAWIGWRILRAAARPTPPSAGLANLDKY
ncbi:MAG: DUF2809 domain-containing protein [Bryobacteraceae bacterium]